VRDANNAAQMTIPPTQPAPESSCDPRSPHKARGLLDPTLPYAPGFFHEVRLAQNCSCPPGVGWVFAGWYDEHQAMFRLACRDSRIDAGPLQRPESAVNRSILQPPSSLLVGPGIGGLDTEMDGGRSKREHHAKQQNEEELKIWPWRGRSKRGK